MYGTNEGPKEYVVTAMTPQNLVVEWNACMMGYLLSPSQKRLRLSLAVDLVVVVIARHLKYIKVFVTETMRSVNSWLERAPLTLVDGKMEEVLITKSYKEEYCGRRNRWMYSRLEPAIKCLGVMIYAILRFREQLKYTCQKETSAIAYRNTVD